MGFGWGLCVVGPGKVVSGARGGAYAGGATRSRPRPTLFRRTFSPPSPPPHEGLDSYTANKVMDVVKGLAKGGLTVCATIHSPTAHAFALFDR